MANDQDQEGVHIQMRKLLMAFKKAVQEENVIQAREILEQLNHQIPNLEYLLTKIDIIEIQESLSKMLHILGGQFCLAITKRNWEKALKIGEIILNDYPNSEMASHVRGEITDLKVKVNRDHHW